MPAGTGSARAAEAACRCWLQPGRCGQEVGSSSEAVAALVQTFYLQIATRLLRHRQQLINQESPFRLFRSSFRMFRSIAPALTRTEGGSVMTFFVLDYWNFAHVYFAFTSYKSPECLEAGTAKRSGTALRGCCLAVLEFGAGGTFLALFWSVLFHALEGLQNETIFRQTSKNCRLSVWPVQGQ